MGEQIFGYLAGCADKRFHAAQQDAFMQITGFDKTDFWVHFTAGGAATIVESDDWLTADYAYHHGARVIGVGNHGDGCGGRPGEDNLALLAALDAASFDFGERFPDASVVSIWSEGPEDSLMTIADVMQDPLGLLGK